MLLYLLIHLSGIGGILHVDWQLLLLQSIQSCSGWSGASMHPVPVSKSIYMHMFALHLNRNFTTFLCFLWSCSSYFNNIYIFLLHTRCSFMQGPCFQWWNTPLIWLFLLPGVLFSRTWPLSTSGTPTSLTGRSTSPNAGSSSTSWTACDASSKCKSTFSTTEGCTQCWCIIRERCGHPSQ